MVTSMISTSSTKNSRKKRALSKNLVAAAACGALTLGCAPAEEERLQLGFLTSMTGPLAEAGVAQLEAARLAAEQINAAGGVLGKQLVLVVRDDGSDVRKAERAIDALLEVDLPVILGTVSSSLTLLAAERALGDRVMISASASAPALTQFADGGRLFRTCSSAEREGALLAQRARARSLGRAAILHRDGASEAGIAVGFSGEFTRAGGTVVFQRPYPAGQPDYRELLRDVLAKEPDTVVLDADPVDGAQLVRDALAHFPGTGVTWVFSHAQQNPAFVEGVGAHNFTFPHFGAGPGTPTGRRYVAFVDAYARRYGEPPALGAHAANMYDAVFLTALALESRGGTSDGLSEAILQVSLGGLAFGADEYADAVSAQAAGTDINYEGASGSVDLDRNGDTSAPYDVWEVRDARIELTERAVSPAG